MSTSLEPPVASNNKLSSDTSNNQDLFEQMIRTFEAAGMPYCILAGYDEYPQHIASDIDFMVLPAWNDRLPGLIAAIAAAAGAQLIQHFQHETTASYFILARLNGDHIDYLQPDSSSDYRRNGRLWMHAAPILKNRRRHKLGFWIPSAVDAFNYYLIKKLDKENLNASQAKELAARYMEDVRGCRERLYSLLPTEDALLCDKALRSNLAFDAPQWRAVQLRLPSLKQSLHDRAELIVWSDRFKDKLHDLYRMALRCIQPTGLRVVFLGPDGSGKSTVIAAVTQQLGQAFRHIEYRHLRSGKLPKRSENIIVTDPHAKPLRGLFGSLAKLFYFWSDYLIGSLLWLYPRYVRSTLVIFDRYYQDLLADPARYRYNASLPLAKVLGRCLPQPDLVFILDAPAEVLQSRKQEVSLAESARQRDAYRQLTSEFREVYIIDTSLPVEQVVASVLEHTLGFLERRAASRLHLKHTTQGHELCKP